jgi:hypothetical protein
MKMNWKKKEEEEEKRQGAALDRRTTPLAGLE